MFPWFSSVEEVEVKVAQSRPTLCDPIDSTVHGILQARMLEWVAVPFSRGSSQPGIEPRSPALQVDSLPAEPPGKPKLLTRNSSPTFPWVSSALTWSRSWLLQWLLLSSASLAFLSAGSAVLFYSFETLLSLGLRHHSLLDLFLLGQPLLLNPFCWFFLIFKNFKC